MRPKKRSPGSRAVAVAAPVKPTTTAPKGGYHISERLLGAAAAPKSKRSDPFKPAERPPGVGPKKKLAADSAFGAPVEWAFRAVLAAGFNEGLYFMGFPVLAELAQRPEFRKVTETIARHMTRNWIKFSSVGDEDKSERIKVIEDEFKRLKVQAIFRKAVEHDGYFGRGHVFVDLGNDNDRELKTSIGDGSDATSIGKLKNKKIVRLTTVEPVWVYPNQYDSTDPLSPEWYRPQTWFVMQREVHTTRLLTLIGREVPDLLKPAYAFAGLSMTQMLKPYVDNFLRTRQSVSDIVNSFSVFVLYTNLLDKIAAGESEEEIIRRVRLFNEWRASSGTLVVDKDMEDFKNISASLSGLDVLQAQSQEQMASIASIPLVELLGISPHGLNASSEGEVRTFEDMIHSAQEHYMRDPLTAVTNMVMLSKFGEIDPDISFSFEPLWTLNEKEIAEKQKVEAETDQIHVNLGAVTAREVRKRLATDEDTPWASLDLNEEPETPPEKVAEANAKAAETIIAAFAEGVLTLPRALESLQKLGDLFSVIREEDIREAEAAPKPSELPGPPEPEADTPQLQAAE